MFRVIIFVGILLSNTLVFADSLDTSLNDSSVNVTVAFVKNKRSPDALQVQLGYMHNVQSNRYISAGLSVIGETGQRDNPIELGVGTKIIGIESSTSGSFYGGTIGLEVRYYPKRINRLALSGQYYYGPTVIVSNPASNFQELSIRAEYQILPQAFAYVGYRNVDISLLSGGNDQIDQGAHVGFRILLQ